MFPFCYTRPSLFAEDRLAHLAVRRFNAFVLLALTLAAATTAYAAGTLDRIRDRHAIVFAYREGASPFSFKDRSGAVRGYSVELCNRIAAALERELRISPLKVEWLAVDADTRIDAVAKGRADAECGTTTITLSRMERVDFSVPIFVDGATLLVHSPSPIQRLADVKGRRVAVIRDTTTERALRAALDVADATAIFVTVARPEDGAKAVLDGRADAFAGDRIVLTQLLSRAEDKMFALLQDDFSYEPYAIVVPRNDPDFRLAVNRALVTIYKRGDIDEVFQHWLAPLGRPSALLNAMFYLNALPD